MAVETLGPRHAQGVVPIATDLLGMAQRGEIKMLAIAYVHEDGATGLIVSGGTEYSKLIGAVTMMQFDMLASHSKQS